MNKIRTVLLVGAVLCSSFVEIASVKAQQAQAELISLDTNSSPPAISGPGMDLLKSLTVGSNLLVAPYAIIASGGKHGSFGGGLGIGYHVNDYVVPTIRLDYLNHTLWMPSASMQLQAPFTLLQKVTVLPFGFGGIATPIAGKGKDNGSAVGIFGAGLAARLDFLGSSTFLKNTDLIGDIEQWSGFAGNQKRVGLCYRF